jgi:hypothetical protein
MGGVMAALRSSRRLLTLVTALATLTVVAVVLAVSAVASAAGPAPLPTAVHPARAAGVHPATGPVLGAADPAAGAAGTAGDGTASDGTAAAGTADGSAGGDGSSAEMHASDDPEGEFAPGDSGGSVLAPDPAAGDGSDQSSLEDAP